ncbi:MAG: PQQ-binding-like beta-propeller repeat protein [Phycisphaerales bacterium]|nr:PQQ-binding-like beta-propeller repeat protein [Phycisphaerales bacterium]
MMRKLICLAMVLSVSLCARGGVVDSVKSSGVTGGLVVHVGCGDGKITAALRVNNSFVVQGIDTDPTCAAQTRAHADSLGLGGKVLADTFDGKLLPYTDNLVNLLVVSKAYQVSKDEMLRVLSPGGVAIVDGKKITKPRKNIDEWTHYLHDPGNNAVANDTVVGPPRHMQWLGAPRWTRTHHGLNSISAVVTAGGRLFYIVDESTAASNAVPGKWTIVARDAFSGVELWKSKIESWSSHRLRFRSGPPQVTRLLVARGDRVYAPLGLSSPVSELDAITGKTLRTFKETLGAEEIVLTGDTLLVLKGAPVAAHAVGHPDFKDKFKNFNAKTIVAMNLADGKKLWSVTGADVMAETLGSDGKNAYFQNGANAVQAVDLKTGRAVWTYGTVPVVKDAAKAVKNTKKGKAAKPRRRRGGQQYGKSVLVVSDGVVLCNLSQGLAAISVKTGKRIWGTKRGAGFHAPMDIFVIDGLVWTGSHPRDSISPPPVDDFSVALDLHTGEGKKRNQIMVDLQTAGHHHRFYREKATSNYIITGKRGFEMMNLTGDNHSRNNWIRGTCQYGMLPANGLTYAPSHSCGCYMESKLWGFWAMAPARPKITARKIADDKRLQKGPAFGKVTPAPAGGESWSQYRSNALRSGIAKTVLPGKLKSGWTAKLGGVLSQAVIGGGKVLLASVDAGKVYALDETTGKIAWQYAAGGRVDSPPAIYKSMAIFGSADGWVYCLRLSDGALVWKFLAARADVKAVAMEQVESLWPVHGSVMILNDIAYFGAGRSTWIDSGIDMYGLDPVTGKIVHKSHYESAHPKIGDGKADAKPEHNSRVSQTLTDYKTYGAPDRSDSFSMAGGCVRDVLCSDGKNVFMHHAKFNPELALQAKQTRHLFSTSGMLDGSENHRSHFVLGTGDFSKVGVAYSWVVNGKRVEQAKVPFALMMVFDDTAVWGVKRQGGGGKYVLFQRGNSPFSDSEKSEPDFGVRKKSKAKPAAKQAPAKKAAGWTAGIQVRPRAMIKSGDNLYFGTMPVTTLPGDPYAAFEGRMGGSVTVVSSGDGKQVAEYKLESPAVWDGISAANGKLFVSTEKGVVHCLGKK